MGLGNWLWPLPWVQSAATWLLCCPRYRLEPHRHATGLHICSSRAEGFRESRSSSSNSSSNSSSRALFWAMLGLLGLLLGLLGMLLGLLLGMLGMLGLLLGLLGLLLGLLGLLLGLVDKDKGEDTR